MIEEYRHIDSYKTSREYRVSLREQGKFEATESLQYGEIDILDFAQLLKNIVAPNMNEESSSKSFLDIGMGSGKAVMVAACSGLFEDVQGIEIVEQLHVEAMKVYEAIDAQKRINAKVELIRDDCFNHSWAAFDVVFLPVTCFTAEMIEKVVLRVKNSLKAGTCLICTSTLAALSDHTMCGSSIKRIHEGRFRYGKGKMRFTVYRVL